MVNESNVMLVLTGEPGVGKTAAMHSIVAGLGDPAPLPPCSDPPRPARVGYSEPDSDGQYRAVLVGGIVGTDSLSGDATRGLRRYIAAGRPETRLLLVEGAAAASPHVIRAAGRHGWTVQIVELIGPDVAASRRAGASSNVYARGYDPSHYYRVTARAMAIALGCEHVEHHQLEVQADESPDALAARVVSAVDIPKLAAADPAA